MDGIRLSMISSGESLASSVVHADEIGPVWAGSMRQRGIRIFRHQRRDTPSDEHQTPLRTRAIWIEILLGPMHQVESNIFSWRSSGHWHNATGRLLLSENYDAQSWFGRYGIPECHGGCRDSLSYRSSDIEMNDNSAKGSELRVTFQRCPGSRADGVQCRSLTIINTRFTMMFTNLNSYPARETVAVTHVTGELTQP